MGRPSKLLVLGQRHRLGGRDRMMVRGVFTQKKLLWDALEDIVHDIGSLTALDDVAGQEAQLSYKVLCDRIRKAGRLTITSDGERLFLVVESPVNSLRDWDVNDEGEPRYNPVNGHG